MKIRYNIETGIINSWGDNVELQQGDKIIEYADSSIAQYLTLACIVDASANLIIDNDKITEIQNAEVSGRII